MLTNIHVTFTTDTLENAKVFSNVFMEEIDHYSGVSTNFEEKSYPLHSSDEEAPEEHKYVHAILRFKVETMTLSDEMDSIPSFLQAATYSNPIVPKINDDWTISIFIDDDYNGTQVHESIYHLYRSSQEDYKTINALESQNTALHMEIIKLQARMESVETKYNSLMAYLHTGLNIKAMAEVLVETANQVDPDILDRYQLQAVRIN